MNKNGPVIVIEDDEDDREILDAIFKELNYENEVVFFQDGLKALAYLHDESVNPFLILSDINMPQLNGFELRDKIRNDEALNLKCIPYLFFTTAAEQPTVITAYSKSVQGFFIKPGNYNDIKDIVKAMMDYWKKCQAPNI